MQQLCTTQISIFNTRIIIPGQAGLTPTHMQGTKASRLLSISSPNQRCTLPLYPFVKLVGREWRIDWSADRRIAPLEACREVLTLREHVILLDSPDERSISIGKPAFVHTDMP